MGETMTKVASDHDTSGLDHDQDHDNTDYYNSVIAELNECIISNNWNETVIPIVAIENFKCEPDKMAKLMALVKFGRNEWNTLKQTEDDDDHVLYPILDILAPLIANGDKALVSKLMEPDNVVFLVKLYMKKYKAYDCSISRILMHTMQQVELNIVEGIIPTLFPRVVHNMKKQCALKHMVAIQACTLLICAAIWKVERDGMRKLLECNIVVALEDALQAIEQLDEETVELDIWQRIINTLHFIIYQKDGTPDDIVSAIPGVLKTMEIHQFSCPGDGDYLMRWINLMNCLVIKGSRKHVEMLITADYNYIQTAANVLQKMTAILATKEDNYPLYPNCNLYQTTIACAVRDIAIIGKDYPDLLVNRVGTLLPIVAPVTTFLLAAPSDEMMSEVGICLLGFMVAHGTKGDVEAMLQYNLMPALVEVNRVFQASKEIVKILYDVVLKVHDNIDLKDGLVQNFDFLVMCFSRIREWNLEPNLEYYEVLTRSAYIEIAMADFIHDSNAEVAQVVLDKTSQFFNFQYAFFRANFKIMKTDYIHAGLPSFMAGKMFKHKVFRLTVLHQTWFILTHGDKDQREEMVEAINTLSDTDNNCNIKGNTGTLKVDKRSKALNFVMRKTKDIIEEHEDYSSLQLTQTVQFLTEVSLDGSNDDETLFWLEDMVSPCLGLLQNQNDESIISNVKQFINNLHY